jgi:hypothetical protein
MTNPEGMIKSKMAEHPPTISDPCSGLRACLVIRHSLATLLARENFRSSQAKAGASAFLLDSLA